MRKMQRILGSLILLGVLGATILMGGCAVRIYDPGHSDYHRWNHQEEVYYVEWEKENHRRHENFRDRGADEQRQYWDWRHQHEDHH